MAMDGDTADFVFGAQFFECFGSFRSLRWRQILLARWLRPPRQPLFGPQFFRRLREGGLQCRGRGVRLYQLACYLG